MGFRYAALVLDAWLAVVHWLARSFHDRDAAQAAIRDAWRGLPGDALGMAVMRGCGIEAPTRIGQSGGVTAVMVEDPRVERWFRAHLMPVQAQTLGRYILARGLGAERTAIPESVEALPPAWAICAARDAIWRD